MPSSQPRDAALYARVKAEARKRFARWPSAYGSAWLVREYERRGGTFRKSLSTSRKRRRRSSTSRKRRRRSSKQQGVGKWMREEWVQVLPALQGKHVACGASSKGGGKACRPLHRVDARTPPTLREVVRKHGRSKVRSLAQRKAKHMDGRVSWTRGTFRACITRPGA